MTITIDGELYDFPWFEAAIFVAAKTAKQIKIMRFKKVDRVTCIQPDGERDTFYLKCYYINLHPDVVKMIDSKDPKFPRGR